MSSKGNILLGICGGIAAYKLPSLVSLLVQQGYSVRVALSEAGARFASREVLETLSCKAVYSNLWATKTNCQGAASSPVLHIALVDEADIFLVAPASYNWIGKAAAGIADDLPSTLFAAWPLAAKPLLFAPSMNPEMWRKDVLQRNVRYLLQQGCELVEPGNGFLACRAEGQGRMAEPEELYFRLESRLRFRSSLCTGAGGEGLPLRGKKVLLTAGPTREFLDPVRYLSNRSSGRLGVALACAARDLGASVTLLLGIGANGFGLSNGLEAKEGGQQGRPLEHRQDILAQQLFGILVLHCDSAVEMSQQAIEHFPTCDWALAVAAVCDFRPAQVQKEKIKKLEGQGYWLELLPNPDILMYWGRQKASGQKVLGFALEHAGGHLGQHETAKATTEATARATERASAMAKLQCKQADAIVLNRVGNLEGDMAAATLIFAPPSESKDNVKHGKASTILREEPNGHCLEYTLPLQVKRDFAAELLLRLCAHWL